FLFGAYWSDPRELGQVKFSSLSDLKAAPALFDAFKELLPVIAGEELVVNRSTPAEPFAALCKVFPGDGALKRSGELRQWQGPGPPRPREARGRPRAPPTRSGGGERGGAAPGARVEPGRAPRGPPGGGAGPEGRGGALSEMRRRFPIATVATAGLLVAGLFTYAL